MMKNVYSVGQVNTYIKNMFAQDFMLQRISVKGEVSNCKYHTSGHIYFTIKDAAGTLNAVMFAGSRKGLKFQMKEGDQVVVTGSVEVYERDGKYQIYAREIELDGAGNLYQKFEALKQELEEMGMFAAEYKQPIPPYAMKIGVVTAPTGAAVQDIRNISARRNPFVQLILYPALVQGDDAVESIVNGIHALDALGVDVVIVGRGGGSIEDLWAFNEDRLSYLSPEGQLREKRKYAADLEEQLRNRMEHMIELRRHKLALLSERLEGVSPVKKLAQGYSYVTDENGHTLTDAEGVKAGDRVKIRLLKGALEAEVTEVLHER